MKAARLKETEKANLERQHRDAAKRLLLAEADAAKRLRRPVREASARLIAQVATAKVAATAELKRAALHGIRQEAETLRQDFHAAVLDARKNARALANGQIKLETAPIRKWVEAASLAPPPNVVEIPLHHAVALDELEAARAASGMSTSWSSRALAQVRSWEAESGSLASALNIAKDLDKRVGVHACTQAATAYSDQHESYWHGLLGTKTGDGDDGETDEGLPYGWTANTYEVWSATLDRGTCPVCWGLDGTMVPIGKEFPGGERPGDVHPSCRCMPMTIFIPDESLKKLPGIQIDYSALKEDVKDYFRGTSLTSLLGKKHISDFLTTSLERSAPEALARKVQNRRAYMAR